MFVRFGVDREFSRPSQYQPQTYKFTNNFAILLDSKQTLSLQAHSKFSSKSKAPMVQNWLEISGALPGHQATHSSTAPDLIHATWGTMPAAAALALHQLTGLPYSMEAHAYDVFKHGGDWLLDEKMHYVVLSVHPHMPPVNNCSKPSKF